MKNLIIIILMFLLFGIISAKEYLLKNAEIYTFKRGVLNGYDIYIKEGIIKKIDKNLPRGQKCIEIDLKGKSIIPGIIDSHNHIGLYGGINEVSENITPEIHMGYVINPDDPKIYYCLTGGVTMTHTMHGSVNAIGGENIVIKHKWGKTAEDIWEKRAVRSIKFALGENPKIANIPGSFPSTRAGISYIIKKAFTDANQYQTKWDKYKSKIKKIKKRDRYKILPPKKNQRMEVLLDLIKGNAVVRCHSYRAEETLELIRLSKEFGFRIMAFEHLHQAYRIADQLKENKIGISIFSDIWNYKTEASEFTPYGLEILYKKGVEISLNSDTSEIMRRLHMEAGKMRRYAGMNDLDALKTITLNPAKLLGVDKFTGSLEVGKEADIAVFDGHPLSGMSKCIMTMIEGEIYFDLLTKKKEKIKRGVKK